MATQFRNGPGADRAEEATEVAKQLRQDCKRLSESSRKLMREYRDRVRPRSD